MGCYILQHLDLLRSIRAQDFLSIRMARRHRRKSIQFHRSKDRPAFNSASARPTYGKGRLLIVNFSQVVFSNRHWGYTLHSVHYLARFRDDADIVANSDEEGSAVESNDEETPTVPVRSAKHDMCLALDRCNIRFFSSRRS